MSTHMVPSFAQGGRAVESNREQHLAITARYRAAHQSERQPLRVEEGRSVDG